MTYTSSILFEILHICISNSLLAMFVCIISFILLVTSRKNIVICWITCKIDGVLQSICDDFLHHNYQWKYLLGPIFYFIAISNVGGCLGLVPLNSLPIFPIFLSMTVTIVAICVGINKKRMNIIYDLVPSGLPIAIKPLLLCVELITIIMKPLILFMRLILNVTIGHYILHTLQSTASDSVSASIGFMPILILLNIMEIATGILQAYLFTVFAAMFISMLTEKHH